MKYSRKVRNSQKQAIVGKKKFYVVKFDSFYPATKQLHCNINYKGFKKAYQRSVWVDLITGTAIFLRYYVNDIVIFIKNINKTKQISGACFEKRPILYLSQKSSE